MSIYWEAWDCQLIMAYWGSWTTLKRFWECLAPRTAKREKVVCELPLISAHQGWHDWWIEGVGLAQTISGVLAVNRGPGLDTGKLWSLWPRPGPYPQKTIGREKSEDQPPSACGIQDSLGRFKISRRTSFFTFFLPKWDNKTWRCERSRDRPKEGSQS